MQIKYYTDTKNEMVVAVASYTGGYADGIDANIADCLVARGLANKKDMTMPDSIRGIAKTYGGDAFDEEIGKAVARDKVLVKYYARVAGCKRCYADALTTLVDAQNSEIVFCGNKVRNATERLDAVE